MKVSDRAWARVSGAAEPPGDPAAKDERDWAANWFMCDRTARVIVSRDLSVLAANSRALQMIAASAFLSICDGRLVAARDAAKLDQAAMKAGAQARAQLLGEVDSGVLLTAEAASNGRHEPVFLALHDLAAPVECDCTDLRLVFDLTPGEQRVILGLLRGQSAREIAAETRRSVLTVRTHLKRAYAKIGVRSHPQLFARLLPFTSVRALAQ